MYGTISNIQNIRTIAVGCVVASIVCTVAIARPHTISLPSISFSGFTGATTDVTSVITITRSDALAASAIVTSIDDVHTQQDLVSYADALMRADPSISQIDIGEQSVSMTYNTAHTILNIKTISDETQATVMSDGTVSVSGSWYRPFYTKVAQASSPNTGFKDILKAHTESTFSPSLEARILARLEGRFQIGAIK